MRLPVTLALLATLAPLAAEACGGELTAQSGTITSPNYPGKYPNNKDCYWTVQAAPGSRIQLKCNKKKFKIPKSTGCTADYLKVNGVYYCGNAKPTEIYVEAPMTLHFHSDKKKNNKGFTCTYTRVTGGPYDPTTTPAPTTQAPMTCKPETPEPTTPEPETSKPTTPRPETPKPTTPKPETPKPTTPKPETPKPTTPKPETPKPTTSKPETPKPTTTKPETPKPTTSKPETPKPSTPKPETPAPTGSPTTSCEDVLHKNSDWNEGWSGYMMVPHSGAVNGWIVTIEFDSHVTKFESYTAYLNSSESGTTFKIKNKEWNAVPQSNPMKLDFLYRFSSGTQPKITSIKFNNEEICGSGGGAGPVTTNGPPATNEPVTTKDPNLTNAPATTEDPNATQGPGCFGDGKYNYDEILDLSLKFYEAQRSGPLPSDNRILWRDDSAMDDSDGEIDLTGGYYDAGDHVKFGFPMAASVTVLAWSAIDYSDAYISAGQMSYMRDAIKWGTDYFIKAHPEDNVFYGQVGNGGVDHAYWGRAEDMTMDRPAYKITTSKPGSDLAGETAASLAAAYIVFKNSNPTYAAECLKHAKELYAFADNYRGKYTDSIPDATTYYNSWSGYNDELVWGAAWLYYATDDNTYLQKAESLVNSLSNNPVEFSWDDKNIGAKLLLAQLTGKESYKNSLRNFCDSYVEKQKSPKGLTWHSPWGNLRYISNAVFVCLRVADLGIKSNKNYNYYDYGRKQIHYMLGDNGDNGNPGRSYVVGYGNNPPVKPHHRGASCPDRPATCDWHAKDSPNPNPQILYGALVGGPDSNDQYKDDRNDYIKNEVTTDYNAGFQGAIAALRMNKCITGPVSTSKPVSPPVVTNEPATTKDPDATEAPVTTADPNLTSGPGCLGAGKYNYDDVLDLSLKFYEAQRSGPLPNDNRITWRENSAMGDSGDGYDLTGGYYDAGDHVKFGFPMAASVTVLAWGAIEYDDAYTSAGQMSYMRDAIKWGTDYFIKAHPEENVFYGQVGNGGVDHAYWGRAEDMTMDRPAYKITTNKPGSDLAGETAASLAAAYIVFKNSNPAYAAECLKHAKELYAFADNYRGKYSDSIPDAANFYKSWSGYNDELVWGAAWLYYATNDNSYLQKAESLVSSLPNPSQFSWDDKNIGAKVLLAQLTGKDSYKNSVRDFCDSYVEKQKSPKGLTWVDTWGNLRYVSNAVFICLRAADIGINSNKNYNYYDYGREQIHYMLGENGNPGRSYVVGYGNNPPVKPHHRGASCPDRPASCGWNEKNSPNPNPQVLFGALVGGPDSNDFYEDDRGDYIKNEVTTDYNAGFQGAVAALRMDTC